MSQRQIATLLKSNALKTCLNNAPKYSTAHQRTQMADKNIAFDPSLTAQKRKEAVVYSREQYTGDMKFHSPNHASSTIKPTLDDIPTDAHKGHEAAAGIESGIEIQRQEKHTEENYWENNKSNMHREK